MLTINSIDRASTFAAGSRISHRMTGLTARQSTIAVAIATRPNACARFERRDYASTSSLWMPAMNTIYPP